MHAAGTGPLAPTSIQPQNQTGQTVTDQELVQKTFESFMQQLNSIPSQQFDQNTLMQAEASLNFLSILNVALTNVLQAKLQTKSQLKNRADWNKIQSLDSQIKTLQVFAPEMKNLNLLGQDLVFLAKNPQFLSSLKGCSPALQKEVTRSLTELLQTTGATATGTTIRNALARFNKAPEEKESLNKKSYENNAGQFNDAAIEKSYDSLLGEIGGILLITKLFNGETFLSGLVHIFNTFIPALFTVAQDQTLQLTGDQRTALYSTRDMVQKTVHLVETVDQIIKNLDPRIGSSLQELSPDLKKEIVKVTNNWIALNQGTTKAEALKKMIMERSF